MQLLSQETPIDSVATPPPVIYYPYDTAALLRQLDFRPFSYDSITRISPTKSAVQQQSTFHVETHDLVLPILCLIMLIYVTWIRYTFNRELRENITVLLNGNLGQQIYRDREFSANIFKFVTFLNFALSIGVLIFLVMRQFEVPMPFDANAYNILSFIAGFSLLYVLRGWIYRILGAIFRISPTLQFFRFNALVIYHLLGILLLPFLLLAAFSDPPVSQGALYAALGLVGLAFLIRLVKGLNAALTTGTLRILYFLLYICALEVAPLLIAFRFLTSWASA